MTGPIEPWPGCYADLHRRRVMTLAKLGLMLSAIANSDASEVEGFDVAELHAEVLMALAIEDANDTDIALEIARDEPDGDILARTAHSGEGFTDVNDKPTTEHRIDMANVGEALMEALRDYGSHSFMQGWHPADCPTEIVGDLLNALDEAHSGEGLEYAERLSYEQRVLNAEMMSARLKRLIREPSEPGSYIGDTYYPVGGTEASHHWTENGWEWLPELKITDSDLTGEGRSNGAGEDAPKVEGEEYLVRKNGYYYRPNAAGYTSNVHEAGRFTLERAIRESHPNGPNGPRDGITYEVAPPLSAPQGEVERLRETCIDVAAHLAAAISLLEKGGSAAKKAAPSDKMFDQMIRDYKRSLNKARAALAQPEAGGE